MPGLPKEFLSPADEKRLRNALAKIDRAEAVADGARQEWAALVREIGISAVARAMDLTPQAVSQRVQRIESAP